MESTQATISSGVRGNEAPNPIPNTIHFGSPPMTSPPPPPPAASGGVGTDGKKERGRPRKYGPPQRSQLPGMPAPAHFRDVVAKATEFLSDGFSSAEKTLKPSNLKRLYAILVLLSSNDRNSRFSFSSTSNPGDAELEIAGLKLKCRDIDSLSDILYKELIRRFNDLISALSDVHEGECHSINPQDCGFEVVILLLRCCMVMLPLMEYDQILRMEKGGILLFMLRKLSSVEVGGAGFVAFRRAASCTGSSTEVVSSTFVCAVLEAFADELLVHGLLRKYLMRIGSSSSGCGMRFKVRNVYHDIGTVLEVICTHFIISAFNEPASKHLAKRLVSFHRKDVRTSEVSMHAALSLLLNPVVCSAPKMFQAYSVLLAAEAAEGEKAEIPAFENYFTALERSVILYARCVPSLCVDEHHFCASGLHESSIRPCRGLSFDSFLQASTRDKLYHLISKLNNSWALSMSNASSFGTESSAVASYVAYAKESLYMFEDSRRNEVLSILTFIIQRCSSDASDNDSLRLSKEESSPEDMFYLASILKLMSSSLLQAIQLLQNPRHPGFLNSCRASLAKIASRFKEFSISLPVQKYLHEMMVSDLERHKESKLMIFHFSGLLFFSYSRRLDFLVKNCLLMIMASLSFLLLQDGSLNALQFAIGSVFQPSLSESPTIQKPPAFRSNSKKIAVKFRKIQETYSRTNAPFEKRNRERREDATTDASREEEPFEKRNRGRREDATTDASREEEREEEDCNGEAFFQCVFGGGAKAASEYEDLTDFVACTKGRDYDSWLKVRKRFVAWKRKKAKGISKKKRNMLVGRLAGKAEL